MNACITKTCLDFSGFNTSKVTNMSRMFSYSQFTSLDLSSFDTSAVTNMYAMFNNAQKLTSLDISSFDFTKVTSYTNIFNKNTGASSTYKIYVKDATAQSWVKGQSSLPSYATVTIRAAARNLIPLDEEAVVTPNLDSEMKESYSGEACTTHFVRRNRILVLFVVQFFFLHDNVTTCPCASAWVLRSCFK